MTDIETAHRDFYIARRLERGGKALRMCNRMPERRPARAAKSILPMAVQAPAA